MYLYHFYAISQMRSGEVAHHDGLATMKKRIESNEDYQELKKALAGDDWKALTICSITLLNS